MTDTLFDLDPASPVPLYRQIQETIIAGLASGALGPRRRLPSSRELAEELAVSRNTINLAYQELLAQGLLISQERRGIFVNPGLSPERLPAAAERLRAAVTGTERPSGTGEQSGHTRSIDWSRRLSPRGDAGLPEVVKPRGWDRYPYSFIPGQVDLSHFPTRAWLRCLREALYHPHLVHSLQDAAGADDPMLVEMIRTRLLPSRGVHARPEEIMVTIGTQHGLDLIAGALLRPGGRALMEDPGYLDTRHILRRHLAAVESVAVDADGMPVPDDLTGADLVFLTPSHHHPTNVTMPTHRRRALLEAAARSGTVVVEDDYDAEFRYAGRPSPSLKALDRTEDVVHLGSFSKFLAPGLRLGFLVGPRPLVDALRTETRYTVRHPPGQLQRAMALFLDSGDYHRTLRLHRDRMRRKWQAMTEGVAEHLPFPTGPFPHGGMSLWVQGPRELCAEELKEAAARRGVLIEPAHAFFADPDAPRNGMWPRATFRLGFNAIPTGSVPAGLAELGAAAREVLGRH